MKLGKNQKAWIAALRANPEQQTTCTLGVVRGNGTNSFCCLGKGCEVAGVGKWKNGDFWNEDENGVLGDSGINALGLRGSNGDVSTETTAYFLKQYNCDSLVEFNDSGFSWIQIADILEKYPEAFFNKSI